MIPPTSPSDGECAGRAPTSHERASGEPWDASYRNGPAPWEIDGPQPAIARLAARGAFAGTVLDAGCGSGDHAVHLAALGHPVVGVDVAPTAIESARRKAAARQVAATFVIGDAFALAKLGRSFDTVLDCGLFHTFDAQEQTRYAASLAAVTAPNGTLYVLCFGDGPDRGPHPVSQASLRAAFDPRNGWDVIAIEPERIETNVHPGGVSAWLATVVRRSAPPQRDATSS